jgi:hypothetical protein
MQHPRTPQYWEMLQTVEYPVFMYPVADPRVPGALEYPLDGVLGLVAKGYQKGKRFKPLNCSVAYAIALAIYMKYDVINVYGVELNTTSEYMHQKGNFAFWNGVAIGKGIELNIECSDGLFIEPLYGFEDEMPVTIIGKYMEEITKQIKSQENDIIAAKGALQLASKLMNTRDAYKGN